MKIRAFELALSKQIDIVASFIYVLGLPVFWDLFDYYAYHIYL